MKKIEIWQTLTLGKHGDYCDAIENLHRYQRNHAKKLLNHPCFSKKIEVREIDLAIVKATSLGFKKLADSTIDRIYKRAEALGLKLCPPEVGPELFIHLNTTSWSCDCRPIVATEPLEVEGTHCTFSMDKNPWDGHTELQVHTGLENPRLCWEDYYQFVFELPRK